MSALSTLMAPPRIAVIVPVDGASLAPGSPRWESFFGSVRRSGLDLHGLYPVVGVVREQEAMASPGHQAAHGLMSENRALE